LDRKTTTNPLDHTDFSATNLDALFVFPIDVLFTPVKLSCPEKEHMFFPSENVREKEKEREEEGGRRLSYLLLFSFPQFPPTLMHNTFF